MKPLKLDWSKSTSRTRASMSWISNNTKKFTGKSKERRKLKRLPSRKNEKMI